MAAPITEYSHDLLDASGKWASQWKEGDEHICWYDGHPFDWFPVPVPTAYDEVRKSYRVFGKFCCFQCAKAWQINNPSFNTPISRCWLAVMAKELFRYKQPTIEPAPEKWVLLSNKISIEDFRRQCMQNKPTETVHPPLLPACMASVSGNTSAVLASICTTRNNETLTGEGGSTVSAATSSKQQLSVYEKYLSEQHQPHAEEADEHKSNSGSTTTFTKTTTPAPTPSSSSTSPTPSPATQRPAKRKAGTLASFMRK